MGEKVKRVWLPVLVLSSTTEVGYASVAGDQRCYGERFILPLELSTKKSLYYKQQGE